MKKYLNFFICAITIALFSCSKDDDNKPYEDELTGSAWYEENGVEGSTYSLYFGIDHNCTLVWHAYGDDISFKYYYTYQHPNVIVKLKSIEHKGIIDDAMQTITLTIYPDSDNPSVHILKRFR